MDLRHRLRQQCASNVRKFDASAPGAMGKRRLDVSGVEMHGVRQIILKEAEAFDCTRCGVWKCLLHRRPSAYML
jgi:hypothetical protein